MFRTAVRRFGTTALRMAEPAAAHEPSSHLLDIARAQRIAAGGFIDGKSC